MAQEEKTGVSHEHDSVLLYTLSISATCLNILSKVNSFISLSTLADLLVLTIHNVPPYRVTFPPNKLSTG